MTQADRRLYLIEKMLEEQPNFLKMKIPEDEANQKYLLRCLFNIRAPQPAKQEFLSVQDAYLQEETKRKGITELDDLHPVQEGIYLWQGDITTLRCDAIVNAANSQMLGCFMPCHECIDNAIHTYAGYNFDWPVQRSCGAKAMKRRLDRQKLPLPLTCRAAMFCIPLGRSWIYGPQKRIGRGWLPAIAPAWSWLSRIG